MKKTIHADMPAINCQARMSLKKSLGLVASITLGALLVGCAGSKSASTSTPVAELSGPQTVKVSYHEAACTRLAPQLVMLARQEHQLTSTQGKKGGSDRVSALADTRRQKEDVRAAMRSNGCF